MRHGLTDRFTKAHLTSALRTARAVKREVESTGLRYESAGICTRWDTYMRLEGFDSHPCPVLKTLFREWPDYSGCSTYPIPMPNSSMAAYLQYREDCIPGYVYNPMEWMYNNTIRKWAGEYGRYRMDCLNYIISRLEHVV